MKNSINKYKIEKPNLNNYFEINKIEINKIIKNSKIKNKNKNIKKPKKIIIQYY